MRTTSLVGLVFVALCATALCTVVDHQTAMSAYHTTEQLSKEFYDLQANCPALQVSMVDKYGKQLMTLRINGGSRKVAFLFGEHSRELISPETALRLVRYLCNVDTDEKVKARVKQVLSKYTFLIFPNVNPDGRKLVEQGRYCHRTNGNNVDLNRNWASHWKAGGPRETAPGPEAFSEGETKLVRDIVAQFGPDVFMSVHSGALGMYTPYAYKKDSTIATKDPNMSSFLERGRDKMIDVLRTVNKDFCRCGVGAAAIELNYLCPGNCMDYAFDKMKVPYSFAFEIWDGRNYANAKTTVLLEKDSEEFLNAVETQEEHDHDHDHEHAEEDQEDLVALSVSEDIHKSIIAPKPQRGHSCFTMFDDFAPTEEMDQLFIEVEASTSAEFTPSKPFPPPPSVGVRQCLVQFNPLTPEQYEQTVTHWSNAFLEVLNKLPSPKSL